MNKPTDLAVDPSDPSVWYAGEENSLVRGGIYRSRAGGARGSWRLESIDYGPQDLGSLDSWTLLLNESCPPMSVPPPVPDGSFGSVMTAVRADPGGSAIQLSWDTAACPAQGYHVLYGTLANVSTYSISGGVCALGTSGHYTWSGVPSGCLWFVLVANNGTGVEGTWGWDSSGAHRGGSTPSGQCGIASRINSGTCP